MDDKFEIAINVLNSLRGTDFSKEVRRCISDIPLNSFTDQNRFKLRNLLSRLDFVLKYSIQSNSNYSVPEAECKRALRFVNENKSNLNQEGRLRIKQFFEEQLAMNDSKENGSRKRKR